MSLSGMPPQDRGDSPRILCDATAFFDVIPPVHFTYLVSISLYVSCTSLLRTLAEIMSLIGNMIRHVPPSIETSMMSAEDPINNNEGGGDKTGIANLEVP
jgi:hypothetical protein